ncbi:MAG: sulfite exporter TauE/SafE family protein [Betaproteobacteria bacterium]|nr:MAG: sulfite exporter TauE/SafE family protein [Betaproteobacteria bacterium]RPI48542.1 MAG: sulfite exporter TauE/SafE family protein [Betaproteobacteria bacterium]
MGELTPVGIAYFVFVMVFSFAMRGSAGFGGLNAPLLLIILPAKIIVPALVMLGVLSSLAIVARDHRHIEWKAVGQTLPYGVAGVAVGVLLFKSLDTGEIEKGLGLFILSYGCYALWRLTRPPRPLRVAPGLLAAVMGATGGLVGTMFGALAGVFVAVFLDILNLPKHEFRATMAATLMLLGIARTLGYFWAGAITDDVMIAFAAALPLMGLGVILGNRLHARLNQIGFSRLVGMLFVLIGGFLFVR